MPELSTNKEQLERDSFHDIGDGKPGRASAAFDVTSKANKGLVGNPAHKDVGPIYGFLDKSNQPVATYRDRFNTSNNRYTSIHLNATSNVTLTVWVSNLEDPSTANDNDWVDTGFSVAAGSKGYYSSSSVIGDRPVWHMIKQVVSNASNSYQADVFKTN